MPATLIPLLLITHAALLGPRTPPPMNDIRFERIVIDADFPGAYQVEIADVDGDGRADIVALGGDTIAWYQNPTWTKRVISGPDLTPAVISSATADLDGDGKAEIAIAYDFSMNEPHRGKLALAVQDSDAPNGWRIEPIGDIPSIHRVRWGNVTDGPRQDLIVAPIFGPESKPPTYAQDQAHLWLFADWSPTKLPGTEKARTPITRPVWHAQAIVPGLEGERDLILTADNLGIGLIRDGQTVTNLVPGAEGPNPNRGCSEIHLGRGPNGRRLLATIEPWHGSLVSVYTSSQEHPWNFEGRTILDDTLDQGHALCLADVDGDGVDEVFAGHRGTDHRVSIYRFDGTRWNRAVLDTAIAAQDLRAGDLDGDGIPDVVAVGGSTKNVVWYRAIRP